MSSQIVMTYPAKRPKSALPLVFTEHGVTMLASVLRSDKAIKMNIAIVDAFISLKELAINYNEIASKLLELERKYDRSFKDIYEAINYLLNKDRLESEYKQRKRIGFRTSYHNNKLQKSKDK
jgi:spore coat polysaccharide biosynthesis predicted glycosyltransferase SpsG